MLPASYSRDDVIANLQSVSLLGLAFAQARGDLLRVAMSDRIHQPYRAAICPMLSPIVPLAGKDGILGAALSGAGPAVLVIVESQDRVERAAALIREALPPGMPEPEMIVSTFESAGAVRIATQTPQ